MFVFLFICNTRRYDFTATNYVGVKYFVPQLASCSVLSNAK